MKTQYLWLRLGIKYKSNFDCCGKGVISARHVRLEWFGITYYKPIAFHKAIHGGNVVAILHGKSTYAGVGYTTHKIALGYEGIVTLNPIPCGFTTSDIDVRCSHRIGLINSVNRPSLGGIQGLLRQLQILIG